jgi:hypothetical protein
VDNDVDEIKHRIAPQFASRFLRRHVKTAFREGDKNAHAQRNARSVTRLGYTG